MLQMGFFYEDIMFFVFKVLFVLYVVGKLEGKVVIMEEVLSYWEQIREKYECFIVEGVGGIFVFLGEDFLVSYVIKVLQFFIIFVVCFYFGIINYIFLIV